jgi:hypothetical protein
LTRSKAERVLDNTREIEAHITQINLCKINHKVEEGFTIPIGARRLRKNSADHWEIVGLLAGLYTD